MSRLVKILSTHYNECDSSCNEQARAGESWTLIALVTSSGGFRCSEETQIVNSKLSFEFHALFG